MKVCIGCRAVKPLDRFNVATTTRDRKSPRCKECLAEKNRRRYLAKREGILAHQRAYALENPEKNRGAKRRYVESHPDRVRAAKRAYVLGNPEENHAAKVNYKARRRGIPGELTGKQWKAILLFYGQKCAECSTPAEERPLSVDHFIPMNRGGQNTWDNAWPLCVPCNARKRDTMPAAAFPPHVETFRKTGTFA